MSGSFSFTPLDHAPVAARSHPPGVSHVEAASMPRSLHTRGTAKRPAKKSCGILMNLLPIDRRNGLTSAQHTTRPMRANSINLAGGTLRPSPESRGRFPFLPHRAILARTHAVVFRRHATAERRRNHPASHHAAVARHHAIADGRLAHSPRPIRHRWTPRSRFPMPNNRCVTPINDFSTPISPHPQPLRAILCLKSGGTTLFSAS